MGMTKNTRKRGREPAGMSREGRRTMEKVLENKVRDKHLQNILLKYFEGVAYQEGRIKENAAQIIPFISSYSLIS